MTLGNNLVEKTDFNTRLQPTFIKLGTTSNPTSVLQLGYEYTSTCQTANNGNVLKQTITAPGLSLTRNYCYDALNRLASANENSGSSWIQTYDYDRYGNRAVRAGSYMPTPRQTPTSNSPADLPNLFGQSNNRIIAILPRASSTDYGYDLAGNLTSAPDKVQGQPSDTMTYDAENRQKTFNGTVGQYFYDGDGHRVKKIDNMGTTVFVYNAGGQLIAEYHSDPAPPAAGGGGTSYLTTDHLGSTRVVTDGQGNVKARHDYLPFGEELGAGIGQRTAALKYDAPDSTRQKFTQKERDNESGLDYFLARYYSSAQGRFTSPDEFTGGPDDLFDFVDDASDNPTFYADLHEPQSLNKYQYAYNNPLRYIDPDGHGIKDWLKSAAQTAGEFAGGVARGVAASMSYGTAPHSGPSADDSISSRLGQAVGSALVIVGGTQTASAGVAVSGTGVGALVGVPVAVAGVVAVVGGVVNAANVVTTPIHQKSGTPTLSEHKEALKEVHKEVGRQPKEQPGKFGSPQRGTPRKGYRLDPGHPGKPKADPERGRHINWWDYTKGKRGSGGRSGAVPVGRKPE